jgi:hypothetical protein
MFVLLRKMIPARLLTAPAFATYMVSDSDAWIVLDVVFR